MNEPSVNNPSTASVSPAEKKTSLSRRVRDAEPLAAGMIKKHDPYREKQSIINKSLERMARAMSRPAGGKKPKRGTKKAKGKAKAPRARTKKPTVGPPGEAPASRREDGWAKVAEMPRDKFFAYLKATMRSELLDGLRARKRDKTVTVDDEEWARLASSETGADGRLLDQLDTHTHRLLFDELKRLHGETPEFRLLWMVDAEGHSTRELATLAGCSEPTMRKRLLRARKTVRQYCKEIMRDLRRGENRSSATL